MTKLLYCFHCSYRTKWKGNLRRHVDPCHRKANSSGVTPPKLNYRCCLCTVFTAHKRDGVIRHYVDNHGVVIENVFQEFENVLFFQRWKGELEKKEMSSYTVISSRVQNGSKYLFYRCHRDGCYVPKGKGERRMKTKGTNKMNGCCPASMLARVLPDGKVKVKFNVTHVGHEKEVGRLRLDRQERESIAAKLREEVPFKTVLNVIKNGAKNQNVDRFLLTNTQDLYNIVRDFNLRDSNRRHQDDRVSVASSELENKNLVICADADPKIFKQELIEDITPTSKDLNSTILPDLNPNMEKLEQMSQRLLSLCRSSDDYKFVMSRFRSMISTLESLHGCDEFSREK